jgi:hypothetical protein
VRGVACGFSIPKTVQKDPKLATKFLANGNLTGCPRQSPDERRVTPLSALPSPRMIVEELDRHIQGQDAAKRAVATAIRVSLCLAPNGCAYTLYMCCCSPNQNRASIRTYHPHCPSVARDACWPSAFHAHQTQVRSIGISCPPPPYVCQGRGGGLHRLRIQTKMPGCQPAATS